MKVLTALLTLLTLFTARALCQTQAPGEGYVRTADGVRLSYKIVGSGPETLVAVHGGPGNTLESTLPDLEPLAKNRRVIYYDQRGGGRSGLVRDKEKLSIEKHVEQPELFGAVETFLEGGWPPAAKRPQAAAEKE